VTEQALKNFKDISHEVDSISLRILNITEASIEQETTLEKTVSGMQGIHKTTEMNSEIAYQSSQAATLLDNETFNLQHISRSISRSIIGRVMSEQEMSSKNKKLNSFAFEKSDSQQKRAS
jgi:methyl-accepting chemotaxis protein